MIYLICWLKEKGADDHYKYSEHLRFHCDDKMLATSK